MILNDSDRIKLLENRVNELKFRLEKADKDASAGLILGIMSALSLIMLSIIIIGLALNNGILDNNFIENVIGLIGISVVGILIPALSYVLVMHLLRK